MFSDGVRFLVGGALLISIHYMVPIILVQHFCPLSLIRDNNNYIIIHNIQAC